MSNAVVDMALALHTLRARAEGHGPFGDKDMRVSITFEHASQMHMFERSMMMDIGPAVDPRVRFLGHKFDLKAELMGIPFELQVRRDRSEVLRDLNYVEHLIKRLRSSL